MKKYNAQKVCCLTIGVVLLVNGILAACLSNFHIGILITDILGACFCAAAFFYDRLDRILPKWLKYVFYALQEFV